MWFSAPIRAFSGSDAVVSAEATFDISADGSRILLRRAPEVNRSDFAGGSGKLVCRTQALGAT